MRHSTGNDMDISIVIPLYKGEKYIERLMQMIKDNYLYKDLYKECKLEVIFVNDFPNQKIDVSEDLFFVRVITNIANQGIHQSRVNGIAHAKGEYIIMFDQDDLVRNNYLYSQWKKIKASDAEVCVCKGWSSRFRTIGNVKNYELQINSIDEYILTGNPIMSPGQVIIKRTSIPNEWKENIQMKNGADDCFLWILALIKGLQFISNEEYLFYHTPERTNDSVSSNAMTTSLEEMEQILEKIGCLNQEQKIQLAQQIQERKYLIDGVVPDAPTCASSSFMKKAINIKKFRKMFLLMTDWVRLKNQGKFIDHYLEKNGYLNIAIHGMGYIGELLYEELENSSINVKYAVDRSALDFKEELKVIKMDDIYPEVDLIISTVLEASNDLVGLLKEKSNCSVLRIDEILEVLKED